MMIRYASVFYKPPSDLWPHKVLSAVAAKQVSISKLPPKVWGSHDHSKVLLCNFDDVSLRSLAKAGQQIFHHHIAVVEAFPSTNDKERLCWKSLIQATSNSEELKDKLNSVGGDTQMKRDLIDYISFVFIFTH